eukprot:914951-Lingulodinium_polyedra.AAC.1
MARQREPRAWLEWGLARASRRTRRRAKLHSATAPPSETRGCWRLVQRCLVFGSRMRAKMPPSSSR